MNGYDAYRTARVLAAEGRDSDAVTHADIDTAADIAGAARPTADDRHTIRDALHALNPRTEATA